MATESVEDDYECLLLTFDWRRGVQGRNGMPGMDLRVCLNSDRARRARVGRDVDHWALSNTE